MSDSGIRSQVQRAEVLAEQIGRLAEARQQIGDLHRYRMARVGLVHGAPSRAIVGLLSAALRTIGANKAADRGQRIQAHGGEEDRQAWERVVEELGPPLKARYGDRVEDPDTIPQLQRELALRMGIQFPPDYRTSSPIDREFVPGEELQGRQSLQERFVAGVRRQLSVELLEVKRAVVQRIAELDVEGTPVSVRVASWRGAADAAVTLAFDGMIRDRAFMTTVYAAEVGSSSGGGQAFGRDQGRPNGPQFHDLSLEFGTLSI